ncbi:hypothetical protein ACEN88_29735, partial [Massilia sp. CT11-108]|uniref:hypothetical protein n=1 Tax=Massilia sp. CT11-108 TaxID=3393900 RepID=UPI0039A7430D
MRIRLAAALLAAVMTAPVLAVPRDAAHPATRQDAIADLGDDFGNSLAGTDAATLMAEAERHAQDWDLHGTARARACPP